MLMRHTQTRCCDSPRACGSLEGRKFTEGCGTATVAAGTAAFSGSSNSCCRTCPSTCQQQAAEAAHRWRNVERGPCMRWAVHQPGCEPAGDEAAYRMRQGFAYHRQLCGDWTWPAVSHNDPAQCPCPLPFACGCEASNNPNPQPCCHHAQDAAAKLSTSNNNT